MNKLEGIVNAGYNILQAEDATKETGYALGKNKAGHYVTWRYRPDTPGFFWGHYHNTEAEAKTDYHTRLMETYKEIAQYEKEGIKT